MRVAKGGVVLVLVALGVVLSGCGEPNEPGSSAASEADSYVQALWDLTEKYTAECMQGKGFDYQPAERPEVDGESTTDTSVFGLSAQDASERGFGVVDEQVKSIRDAQLAWTSDPSAVPIEHHDAAYTAALTGDGSDGSGCRIQAASRAAGDLKLEDYPTLNESLEVQARIEAHPKLGAFWAAWSSCMAFRGIDADNQDSLVDEFINRAAALVSVIPPEIDMDNNTIVEARYDIDEAAAAALRLQEIDAAVASVECLEPLRGLWDEIVADAQAGG
jgi:hypothetical protein